MLARSLAGLALVVAVLATGGCFGNRCCGPCVEMCWPGNCCQSWDWYKECDLVEGREYRECKVCDNPTAYQGMIVDRCWAVPAPGAAAAPAPAPAPAEPLPPPAVEQP
jgi:hypothetical protein